MSEEAKDQNVRNNIEFEFDLDSICDDDDNMLNESSRLEINDDSTI